METDAAGIECETNSNDSWTDQNIFQSTDSGTAVTSLPSEQLSANTDDTMTAENRKKVSEFFSHSRLHYISTWGAESKAYVAKLQNQVYRYTLVIYLGLFSRILITTGKQTMKCHSAKVSAKHTALNR